MEAIMSFIGGAALGVLLAWFLRGLDVLAHGNVLILSGSPLSVWLVARRIARTMKVEAHIGVGLAVILLLDPARVWKYDEARDRWVPAYPNQ